MIFWIVHHGRVPAAGLMSLFNAWWHLSWDWGACCALWASWSPGSELEGPRVSATRWWLFAPFPDALRLWCFCFCVWFDARKAQPLAHKLLLIRIELTCPCDDAFFFLFLCFVCLFFFVFVWFAFVMSPSSIDRCWTVYGSMVFWYSQRGGDARFCTIRSTNRKLCYDLARAKKATDGKKSDNGPR